MILHTIVPSDIIFYKEEEYGENKIIQYGECMVEVHSEESGEYSITRIISSNPNDYLRSEIQPGVIIKNIDVE